MSNSRNIFLKWVNHSKIGFMQHIFAMVGYCKSTQTLFCGLECDTLVVEFVCQNFRMFKMLMFLSLRHLICKSSSALLKEKKLSYKIIIWSNVL